MVGSKRTGGKGCALVNIHWTLSHCVSDASGYGSHFRSSALVFGCGLTRPTVVTEGPERDTIVANQINYKKFMAVRTSSFIFSSECFYLWQGEADKEQGVLKLHEKKKSKTKSMNHIWNIKCTHCSRIFSIYHDGTQGEVTEWMAPQVLRKVERFFFSLRKVWIVGLKDWGT